MFNKEDGKIEKTSLTFSIDEFYKEELERHIKANTKLIITSNQGQSDKTFIVTVTEIAYSAVVNAVIKVTITIEEEHNESDKIKLIEYSKTIPCFNFLAVANDRLWALAEGRSYKNKFRPANLAMKVYFCVKLQSVHHWFNQQTGEIEYIDLSTNSSTPDNLETIIPFQGKILFLGRETTQIWSGFEPMTIDDGQTVTLPDFTWDMTLPIGILQKSLFVEVPNDCLFLSKYGIMSVSSINKYQQLAVSYNFSSGINQHLNAQLAFVEDDRDYRSLRTFLYPYGRFLGFKLKYNCMIYQLKKDGAWSIFSENFADSRSFFYDPVSQDLFLGMDDGVLLAYADKIKTQTYDEYEKGAIIWRIHYSWVYPTSTWYNEAMFIACRTLEPLDVNVQIYTDYNDAENLTETISVEQQGGLYDSAEFGVSSYSYRNGEFPYEVLRFCADSMMITLSGKASNQFVFDKLFLTGGVSNGN